MAGSTNFIQFNPGAANQETDAQYVADSQRAGGAINGQIFNDQLANKLFYQMSTWIAAQANAMANKGYTPMDTSVSVLEGVLANIVTFADLKTNQVTVPFSSNPVFNATAANGFRIDLAGNVTGSTLTGATVGQILTFYVVSNSPGNYDFAWPASFVNPPNVKTQSSGNLMTYQFIWDGTNAFPLSTFMNFLQSEITSIQTTLAGKQDNLGFTPVQQGGGSGQLGNKLFLGWDGAGLKAQVDSTDLGRFLFSSVFSASFNPNGWVAIPVGNQTLIFQWAQGSTVSSSTTVTQTVNFPRSFPNQCFRVIPGDFYVSSDDSDLMVWQVTSWGNNSVSLRRSRRGDDSTFTSAPLIFAIGY